MNNNSFYNINKVHYINEEDRIKELLEFLEPRYNSVKNNIRERPNITIAIYFPLTIFTT